MTTAHWEEFTKLAMSGSFEQAVRWMDSQRDSTLAFDACLALAVNHHDAFQGLWDSIEYGGDKVSDFALDFFYGGAMPQRIYALMSDGDYDNARTVYLKAFDKYSKLPRSWPGRDTVSKEVCFYPEFQRRRNLTQRATIAALATRHDNLGPGDRQQANLFSLGGRYGYSRALQGTHPSGPTGKGTTCMLFARSILHAAGFNVIGGATPRSCSCDLGLEKELEHMGCYVITKTAARPPKLQQGDVFHIQGKPFKGNIGSSHVGIFIEGDELQWSVIQGGASDHRTRPMTYTVIPVEGSKEWGNFCLKEDDKVHMTRGIQGYWDIDRINGASRMSCV